MMQDAASGTGVGTGVGTGEGTGVGTGVGVGTYFLDVLTGFIADDFSSGGCESPQMDVIALVSLGFSWGPTLGTKKCNKDHWRTGVVSF